MNRIDYLNKINTYAARFVLEVEGFNACNQYDINIHSENFLIPVLNETFNLSLENLNDTQKKNFPAIDLADFKNRVAFQVTATSDLNKIEKTLEKFFGNELHKHFDVLYLYIITQKKSKYNDNKLKRHLKDGFVFNTKEHVLDKDALINKISDISSTPTIQAIARLYEHEFSDIQIELRKKEFISGCLNNESENISPNLFRINFPDTFYTAELNIDEDQLLADLNEYLISISKKPIKKIRKPKLVRRALRKYNCKCNDWLLHENLIYTFKNLDDPNEPFSKIVDRGTITPIDCKDYYEGGEDKKRVFKHLLHNTLLELCKIKEIEWFAKKEIFRFANNQSSPKEKKVKWKGKKEATKTVIFEMINKKEGHLICFRNLAFKSTFQNIGNEWFIVLNPTWSFTNPGGYYQSRFESSYLSGIKRLENNKSVYNYFRFFGYYLSHEDLFSVYYPYLRVMPQVLLTLSPKLNELTWKPLKISPTKQKDIPVELEEDLELFDNSLFN